MTLEGPADAVRVAKEDGFLIIRVRERGDGQQGQVQVRMPLAAVEAALGRGNEELDLLAALRALGEDGGEDLVRVKTDDTTVQGWVDSLDSAD